MSEIQKRIEHLLYIFTKPPSAFKNLLAIQHYYLAHVDHMKWYVHMTKIIKNIESVRNFYIHMLRMNNLVTLLNFIKANFYSTNNHNLTDTDLEFEIYNHFLPYFKLIHYNNLIHI